jgi:hypothetical protein
MKSETSVTSYKILDLLGELGGFLQIIEIIFSAIGLYISERKFKFAVLEYLYLKKTNIKIPKPDFKNINPYFQKIKFNTCHIFFEPIYSRIYCCKNKLLR